MEQAADSTPESVSEAQAHALLKDARPERIRADAVNHAESIGGLGVNARTAYLHEQVVDQISGERDRLHNLLHVATTEIARLQKIEVVHSQLCQANKSKRIIGGVVAVALVVGGGLVSTFADGSSAKWFATGWALTLLGASIQLCISVFDG